MMRECHVRFWESARLRRLAPLDYLKGYATITELTLGLTEYFAFYNGERPHQALGNRTPDQVYASKAGGGARIADHFSERGSSKLATTGQRRSAATEASDAA